MRRQERIPLLEHLGNLPKLAFYIIISKTYRIAENFFKVIACQTFFGWNSTKTLKVMHVLENMESGAIMKQNQ